jgi:hypothetical protein
MTDPRVERLTAAARKRSGEKAKAAEAAIRKLRRAGQPVNFHTVAREAGVSHSFLYGHDELRQRIGHLRQSRPPRQQPASESSNVEGNIVAILTQQLDALRTRHREEVLALKQSLERALGENLVLRRQLAQHGIIPVVE